MRPLRTSGFLGLAVAMSVGLYQNYLYAVDQVPPFWLVEGYDQLLVLSLVAIVTGMSIERFRVTVRVRRAVIVLVLLGQWLLPATSWIGFGTGEEVVPILATTIIWLPCVIAAMLLLAWQAATTETAERVPPRAVSTQSSNRDIEPSQEQS